MLWEIFVGNFELLQSNQINFLGIFEGKNRTMKLDLEEFRCVILNFEKHDKLQEILSKST